MTWLFLISGQMKRFCLVISGILGLLLLGKNARLARENEKLNSRSRNDSKIIKIQEKLLNVRHDNTPADLEHNLDRMRRGKL